MMYQKKLLSEKIVENIVDLIVKGLFKPGDKMPNELQLSEELNISRATLREAIKTLESRNVLEVKRGIGTYVAQVPGLSKNPLGSEFINFSANPAILFSTIQFQAYQMMTRLKTVTPHDLQMMINQYGVQNMEKETLVAYYESMLKCLEGAAKLLQDELSYRLLIIMQQLVAEYLNPLEIELNDEIRTFYLDWQNAFKNKAIEPLKMTFNEIVKWTLEKVV
ncbi:FadR/GntR family transcriptional regulator [Fusibacter sp. 3D3]|uniref:FadR/GntR family transcriptional regulator n=1 Tax=Fusibacter sp. 3D3 TaxID=1048380 RepID=UPI00085383E6|nr:GntR family transcriptional regulator [Fusibacter sp. 3D3]GAU76936.1 transcriptional regulator [Fusibacter sp. 3D3]